jgi:hypothetical protein
MTDTLNARQRGADGRYQIGISNPSGVVPGTKTAKTRGRAAISNGKLFDPSQVDHRSIQAHRFRDVLQRYRKELGDGELTQWQETALRNIAMLTIAQEKLEQAAASGN